MIYSVFEVKNKCCVIILVLIIVSFFFVVSLYSFLIVFFYTGRLDLNKIRALIKLNLHDIFDTMPIKWLRPQIIPQARNIGIKGILCVIPDYNLYLSQR